MNRLLLIAGGVLLLVSAVLWTIFGMTLGDDATAFTVFPFAIVTMTLGILAIVFGTTFGRFGSTADPALIAEAAAAGRRGYARVVGATWLHTRIGRSWVWDADLVIAATDVPAYRHTDRVRVRFADGQLAGTGELVTVVRLRGDAPEVAVVAGPRATPQDADVPRDAAAWPAAPSS